MWFNQNTARNTNTSENGVVSYLLQFREGTATPQFLAGYGYTSKNVPLLIAGSPPIYRMSVVEQTAADYP
jgi:hypothetical protein